LKAGRDPFKIKDGIHWVATLDPDLKIFDIIMRTAHGSTYNSYLVEGTNKKAIVDAVKEPFFEGFLENLEKLNVKPEEIDYLVVNHNEPDHSGALPKLLEYMPNVQLVVSKQGKVFLDNIINTSYNCIEADDNLEIDLGGKTLKFIIAPFVHWPDTMFTYVPESRVIFTCDFLGSHFCDERMFDTEAEDFSEDFKFYYDGIMRPFKEYVLQHIEKIEKLNVDIIAPSHGPILTQPKKYLELYKTWSQPMQEKLVAVLYVSAYGYTKKLAQEIARGIQSEGVKVITKDIVDVIEKEKPYLLDTVQRASLVAVGSPTINGDAVEPIWEFLSSLATIKIRGKMGFAFGSYGWSGEASKLINQRMKDIKFNMPLEPFRVRFRPTNEDLQKAFEIGKQLAQKVKEMP